MEGSVSADKTEIEIEIDLGESYTDSRTGFEGIATSWCKNLDSPDQVLLENDVSHRWVDVSRLKMDES